MHQIPTQQLDQASFDYLTRIDQSWGAEGTGVFVRRSGRRSDPRAVQRVAVFVGVVAIGLAVVGYGLRNLRGSHLLGGRYVQAAALGLGGGLLASGWLALRRPTFRSPVGEFYWADPLHFWEVTPEQVRYVPLDQVLRAQGALGGLTDHVLGIPLSNQPLYDTFVAITLDVVTGSPFYFTVYDQEAAGRMIHFINAAPSSRQSATGADEIEAAIQGITPGSIDPPRDVGGPRSPLPLPRPHQVEPIASGLPPAPWERLAPWLVAGLLGLLGAVGLP